MDFPSLLCQKGLAVLPISRTFAVRRLPFARKSGNQNTEEMIYQLKIKLRGISKPPVWRRVQVPSQFTFDDLHEVIQAAFGWENEHLYQFSDVPYSRDLRIAIPQKYTDEDDEPIDSRQFTLREFYEQGFSKLCYTYDFGDEWIHDIALEEVVLGERPFATCLDGKGACPPEDCGGRWCYEEMKEEGEIDDPISFSLEDADNAVKQVVGTNTKRSVPKKGKGRKRIYPKDWLNHMPYKTASDIDAYYADIASEVVDILDGSYVLEGVGADSEYRLSIGIWLTQWFQDVVSEGGVWTAFTSECKRRYGRYLPFYDIDENDYYADEVNEVDVRFLLWHYAQSINRDTLLLAPDDAELERLASDIYAVFEREFESAPINDDWRNAYHPQMFEEPLLYSFAVYIDKLVSCDFINVSFHDDLMAEFEAIDDEENDDDFSERMKKDAVVQYLYENLSTIIGLNTVRWHALVLRQSMPDVAERLLNIETLSIRPYVLVDKDSQFMYLKDIANMKDELNVTYKVARSSCGDYKEEDFIPTETVAYCRLTKLDDVWYLNGVSTLLQLDSNELKGEEVESEIARLCRSNAQKEFHEFRKASGGKEFVFIRDRQGVVDFCKCMYGEQYKPSLVPDTDVEYVLLTATPTIGLRILPYFATYFKSDDNPFFDAAKARMGCSTLFVSSAEVDYEVGCRMFDLGMLDEAVMASGKGDAQGRKLLHENAQFLLDYFLGGCRN